ncbi:MAG: hypothetical protein A2297_02885 [Elusimicrobia bacterium RIFOXYB2_FULL_48_7]|nr:MAG: hypothetical protein A2297_02885 [Elusimicrobia bacterium RIFOXYB2_FULL_48_7]
MSNRKREFSVSKKYEVVQAYQKGVKTEEISSMYGISQNSVLRWARAFDEQGLSGLESRKCGPRPRTLSNKVEAAEQIVGSLTSDGQQTGVGKVQGALYRHGFLDLAKETVRRILKRRTDVIVPRRLRTRRKKQHREKDSRY